MAASFFFYDLETSGISPRTSRIMQFAGQRTDMDLNPVGDPVNLLIKLTPDTLPDPDAVMITGITPQKTIAEGLSEAEFLNIFYRDVVKPDTIFTGFNSVRFDDEFMRFINYRNFYDAYGWQWKDNCSRWDILDLIRMTRALRPDGIRWPFGPDGKPSNRLEHLTSVNKIPHSDAHDALADVKATIAMAKLVKNKQEELFNYLLKMRDKKAVASLVEKNEPFVYTSGRFSSEFGCTTVAVRFAPSPGNDASLVYDLREDPSEFIKMSEEELADAWTYSKDPDKKRLPIKTLKYNRVPAVAPLGVAKDVKSQKQIHLDIETVNRNLRLLRSSQKEFSEKVLKVVGAFNQSQSEKQTALLGDYLTVDERLYDGFYDDKDKKEMERVRALSPNELSKEEVKFSDHRLRSLLPLYKARNYPKSLNSEEKTFWDDYCKKRLLGGGQASKLAIYFARIDELASGNVSKERRYLLEELQLYGQSLIPSVDSGAYPH